MYIHFGTELYSVTGKTAPELLRILPAHGCPMGWIKVVAYRALRRAGSERLEWREDRVLLVAHVDLVSKEHPALMDAMQGPVHGKLVTPGQADALIHGLRAARCARKGFV